MAAKKALIITYYWPPSGGAGVQRWIRFVSQLRQNGWEPVICIPENPSYSVIDESLAAMLPDGLEVIKTPIWEPAKLLKAVSRKKGTGLNVSQKPKKTNLIKRMLWTLRGNLLIPDARVFWVKPAVRVLSDYLKKHPVDLLISTGPPHSAHLIALSLKNRTNIPWLADFRDPWVSMDYLQEMGLSPLAWKKHRRLERSVLQQADEVVVVGNTMKREFDEKYGIDCQLIYNGYQEKADGDAPADYPLDDVFSIVHIGNFLRDRNCDDLWQTLQKMTVEDPGFAAKLSIKLVGEVAPNIGDSLKHYDLGRFVNRIAYVPFSETQRHLFGAQLLLLPIDRIRNAEFVLTGKLFEYLKSGRPILLIGPSQGDAAAIIRHCKAGYIADFDDTATLEEQLRTAYEKFTRGENTVATEDVQSFSSVELSKKMAAVMEQTAARRTS